MSAPKNPPTPITESDLAAFLKEDSSFAFEMQVRELFATPGCQFCHGGSYSDPHEQKPRQFDLIFRRNYQKTLLPIRLSMAIECKCLSEFAPMLVYRSPRTANEAGHRLIATTCGDRQATWESIKDLPHVQSARGGTGPFPTICVIHVDRSRSEYQSNGTSEYVGKDIDIVSRNDQGGFKSGDTKVYGRWTQALQSASTLLPSKAETFYGDMRPMIHLVLPILVVPDERLFAVDFDNTGTQQCLPRIEPRTSFFVDYKPPLEITDGPEFKFGHLEIMTFSALKSFVKSVIESDDPSGG